MATIPVEKTSGVPWWLWLLGALLALVVLWFLFMRDVESADDSVVLDGTSQTSTAGDTPGADAADPFDDERPASGDR